MGLALRMGVFKECLIKKKPYLSHLSDNLSSSRLDHSELLVLAGGRHQRAVAVERHRVDRVRVAVDHLETKDLLGDHKHGF